MKKLRLLAISVIAFNFLACSQTDDTNLGGDDVTEQFLSEYNGTFTERGDQFTSSGERFTITRDGEIEVLKHRDVGEANNPVMPPGTHCSFWLRGQVAYVSQLSRETRQRTNEAGESYLIPQTHNLVFGVYQVELTNDLEPGSTTSEGCLAFQEKMNRFLPTYTYGMELFGRGTLRLHTQGWDEFEGGERPEATLDENFVRE